MILILEIEIFIMYECLLIFFLLDAVGLVFFIMLQYGKGVGSLFHQSGSDMFLPSSHVNDFVTYVIIILSAVFFFLSLVLVNLNFSHCFYGSQWDILQNRSDTIEKKDKNVVSESFIKDIPN
ncbi:MAG: Sec translocon subunit SecG [Candidatus Westeberhardia cardiocondylae]|nr:Sec translocon subunit SecG [Candidatus Westeberhardia cardiocondylae]